MRPALSAIEGQRTPSPRGEGVGLFFFHGGLPMAIAPTPAAQPRLAYLSSLLGHPVQGADAAPLGALTDLLVPVDTDDPSVAALVVRPRRGEARALTAASARLTPDGGLVLGADARPAETAGLLSLREHVLDRQIIDINGIRVVRVNDVQLAPANGAGLRVVGIDVSAAGLLRRLGVTRLLGALGVRPAPRVVAWRDVEPIASGPEGLRLRVSRADLARLHPADIGHILSQLDHQHGGAVLAQLEDETAADALGEVADALQARIIQAIDAERAADILEEMDPDEAADILGDLPAERAEDLLQRMDAHEADEVRELLLYGDDSAGGLMTNQFVTLPWDVTAEEAIRQIRERGAALDEVYSVYVVDERERLRGALSLLRLITAPPTALLRDVMDADLVVARPDDSAEHAARLIARYNLLALPVVDDRGRLLGIVTVDDAMDVVLPAGWKARLPRLFQRAS